MSWTEERVSVLKKLWGEGHTAAEIAKQLGGVTRNAVIGKAHRLKLSNRVSPIQQNKKPANANKATGRKPAPERTAKMSSVKTAAQAAPSAKAAKSASPAPAERSVAKSQDAVIPGDLYDLMDLKPRQCRWPSGDPKEEGFGFCGGHALPGLPYCEEHAKVAYQASTRNRIFNDVKEAEKMRKEIEELPAKKATS